MTMTMIIRWTRKECGHDDEDGNDDLYDDLVVDVSKRGLWSWKLRL